MNKKINIDSPLYKEVLYHAARRAMLENETLLKRFVQEHVSVHYNDDKLAKLNNLLMKSLDNDIFDILLEQKQPEYFKGVYDVAILQDMQDWVKAATK